MAGRGVKGPKLSKSCISFFLDRVFSLETHSGSKRLFRKPLMPILTESRYIEDRDGNR